VRPTTDRRAIAIAVLAAVAIGCASDGSGDGGSRYGGMPSSPTSSPASSPSAEPIAIPPVDGPYDWTIDPADFVDRVDNPYFPLTPGTTNVYEGSSDGEHEVVTVEVTSKTKEILGVACVVVKDIVKVDGALKEFTLDWYAQDVDGNVWYFGERTAEYEGGKVATREGSWEAGVDGALPGVIMPADPMVGLAYTQEHYAGEAEDKGKVVAVGEHVDLPYGAFDDVIVTEDWTPLEPKVREHKSYAPGVGVVFEEIVRGGQGLLRLVEVRQD
jgi:hypothetical protein